MAGPLQLARAVLAPLTRTRAFRSAGPVLLPPAERVLASCTRGRLQLSGLLVPSLVLHSTGARSGQPRDTYLMYTPDGRGGAIVAGTAFARSRHPAWTYNLLAHPDATISVRGRPTPVSATLIEDDDEREAAWACLESLWPGYRAYERDSGRTVRLFRLQPVPPARGRVTEHYVTPPIVLDRAEERDALISRTQTAITQSQNSP